MALLTIMLYHYTVTNWGDLAVLSRTTWYAALEFPPKNQRLNNFQESRNRNPSCGMLVRSRATNKFSLLVADDRGIDCTVLLRLSDLAS